METNYAEPSLRLKDIWLKWIKLHKRLDSGMKQDEVAAPFFSAASSQHPADCILLVGKATSGPYWRDCYAQALCESKNSAMRNRLALNRSFVSQGGNGKDFWRFFDRLAELRPSLGRDGVIWSNIAKIGSMVNNPPDWLLSEQRNLAVTTLVEEVREYKPRLVVFTTWNYARGIIEEAFGFTTDDGWTNDDPDGKVSWLCETQSFPDTRFLWTPHPRGKPTEQILTWIARAKMLLAECHRE